MEQRSCPQCDSLCDARAKFCPNCNAPMTTGLPSMEQTLATNTVPVPTIQNPPASPIAPAHPQPVVPARHQQPMYQQPNQQPVQHPSYQQAPQPFYPAGPVQQVNVVMTNNTVPVMVVSQKSVAVALLLTFLFGPLGLFYSTVSGAVIMLIVSIVLATLTLGLSIFITWPICMIWGAMAASSHNKAIVTRM